MSTIGQSSREWSFIEFDKEVAMKIYQNIEEKIRDTNKDVLFWLTITSFTSITLHQNKLQAEILDDEIKKFMGKYNSVYVYKIYICTFMQN